MPDNRKVESNGGVSDSSNPSVDNLEEAVRRLKIQKNHSEDSVVVGKLCPYPDRPGQPDCIYYLRTGLCGYGSNCRFNHPASAGQGIQYRGDLPERVGQPDCGYYLKTGTCKYGSTCKYHHPPDRHGAGPAPPLNVLGLPMRQEEKSCPFYMRTGSCKFGFACKFHHPEPVAPPGTVLTIPGPVAFGMSESSVVPSSGLHLIGVSALSLPGAPYISAPRAQASQTYMPVVVSPSQAIAPGHGWNTYLRSKITPPEPFGDLGSSISEGCMSPLPSTSVLGPDLLYDSKNQGESGSSGSVHLLSRSILHLPERPDQPECRHFMSTGNCKYGSDCKYHHPRERTAQLAANSLGPLGLPLRPGQDVCSYYRSYGLCKYGPTCKYDHPLAGYSHNYCSNFPTLPIFDASFLPYQRNPPMISSQTSPSKSSKAPDRARKPKAATAREKNQDMDTETPKNASEQAASPSHSKPASSELPHDQSD